MKVGSISRSQNFAQNLTSNLTQIPSLTVPIAYLVKQLAQVAVADET